MEQKLLLEKAIKLARQVHTNQLDKAGKAYFEHPLRVMNNLTTLEEKIVGILHDAIEDSDLTLEDLRQLGFPEILIDAIDAITKRHEEDYEAYLQRVISNPLALRVKIADMQDNMNIKRIDNPTAKDYQRLEKYQQVLPRLYAALKFSSQSVQLP